MYQYGNDAIGANFIQRQARRVFGGGGGGGGGKKGKPVAKVQRSIKSKVVRNYAGGSSCEGAIGLVRTSGTTSVPCFLATESLCQLTANPGRHIGAVEIRSGGTQPMQFLSSVSLRDGDLISGSGFLNTTCIRAEAPRGFFAARISPVTPVEFTVQRAAALGAGLVEPIDLGVMVMA